MSWIHRDDLVELIVESLKNPAYSGIYNATAPKPVRMSELCSNLGASMCVNSLCARQICASLCACQSSAAP